jgi:predicted dithiol-disulfide oxidoreductase (DUF899 family)
MSVTILYRNPARPDEACMTMIMGQQNAEAAVDHLEHQGFLIEKITFAPLAKSAQAD